MREVCKRHAKMCVIWNARVELSRKFWSGENFGPGDQNSRKIGPPGPLFPENLGPAVE